MMWGGCLHRFTLLHLVWSLFWFPTSNAWFPGVEPRYVEETLIDAGALGLPNTGLVMAFGDYNADQLLDLFYVSSDQRTLSVYVWDRTFYQWKEKVESRVHTTSDFIIVNVVPGDFNYDGRLDVLLMGRKNPGGWWESDETLEMAVYLQLEDGKLSPPIAVDSSTLAQPLAFDATGDMRVDLLGFPAGGKNKPMLWTNVWDETNHTTMFELNPPSFEDGNFQCKFPNPHFNAYIDLDGDCLADLFFVCQDGSSVDDLSYQIWLNDKERGFKHARSGQLPTGTKSISFADMDRDGTIDLILTSCSSDEDCNLSIAYNTQMPLCDGSGTQTSPCRDPENLCVADGNFSFTLSSDSSSSDMTTVPITALFPGMRLVTKTTSFRGDFPIAPSVGDFNIDGYPDLLLLTSQGSSRHVNLLESRPCDKGSCSADEIKKGRRAFRVVTAGAAALTKIKDAESAHWVDLDDDGSLDILVQRSGNTGAARYATFIKNNYFHDAFFLKALVLNGACQGAWCESRVDGGKRYRPYGVSYSGASYKFTVLDPKGARKATQYGQLPQTCYLPLGTPYSYFGLGRTNNYVENLFIGSTRHQREHFINIEGLIPNSQVVIDPYQPKGRNDPRSWTRELYLHPGDWIPWVTIVLGAAIILLGVVVIFLHVKEKREDELERRARLLSLNFQAL